VASRHGRDDFCALKCEVEKCWDGWDMGQAYKAYLPAVLREMVVSSMNLIITSSSENYAEQK
jgi:DNA-binding transcriptional regulator PaaX